MNTNDKYKAIRSYCAKNKLNFEMIKNGIETGMISTYLEGDSSGSNRLLKINTYNPETRDAIRELRGIGNDHLFTRYGELKETVGCYNIYIDRMPITQLFKGTVVDMRTGKVIDSASDSYFQDTLYACINMAWSKYYERYPHISASESQIDVSLSEAELKGLKLYLPTSVAAQELYAKIAAALDKIQRKDSYGVRDDAI